MIFQLVSKLVLFCTCKWGSVGFFASPKRTKRHVYIYALGTSVVSVLHCRLERCVQSRTPSGGEMASLCVYLTASWTPDSLPLESVG